MKQTFAIAKVMLLRTLRDKISLFFTFLFPLIFLMIFGSIFGGNDSISFEVALINQSETKFAKQFVKQLKKDEMIKVNQKYKTLKQAEAAVEHSKISTLIYLDQDFGKFDLKIKRPTGKVELRYLKGSEQASQVLGGYMSGFTDGINKGMGRADPYFSVVSQPISSTNKKLKAFDYIFASMLTFALMSMGIFGLGNIMPTDKNSGVYRRLRAAGVKPYQIIFGNSLAYVIMTSLSALTVIVAAILFFDLHFVGSLLSFVPFLLLAEISLLAFGSLVGGWAQNEQQAQPILNLVTFPMMFLSGVFIPVHQMPEFLQNFAKFIPLSSIVDGFRMIVAQGFDFSQLIYQISILLVTTIIIYALAIKAFRWQ